MCACLYTQIRNVAADVANLSERYYENHRLLVRDAIFSGISLLFRMTVLSASSGYSSTMWLVISSGHKRQFFLWIFISGAAAFMSPGPLGNLLPKAVIQVLPTVYLCIYFQFIFIAIFINIQN
jgi:hypothetical protein